MPNEMVVMKKKVSPTINPAVSEYAQAVWEDESPAQGGQMQLIRQERVKASRG